MIKDTRPLEEGIATRSVQMATTANKGLMEIIREFAKDHPLSGYDCLNLEQHKELLQILSDHSYRARDLKEVRQQMSQDHRLVMMYIDRKKYPTTESPCDPYVNGDHSDCQTEDESVDERVCKLLDQYVL